MTEKLQFAGHPEPVTTPLPTLYSMALKDSQGRTDTVCPSWFQRQCAQELLRYLYDKECNRYSWKEVRNCWSSFLLGRKPVGRSPGFYGPGTFGAGSPHLLSAYYPGWTTHPGRCCIFHDINNHSFIFRIQYSIKSLQQHVQPTKYFQLWEKLPSLSSCLQDAYHCRFLRRMQNRILKQDWLCWSRNHKDAIMQFTKALENWSWLCRGVHERAESYEAPGICKMPRTIWSVPWFWTEKCGPV